MKEEQLSPPTRYKSISLQLLDELFPGQASNDVGVSLWDGTLWPDDQPRPATIVLNHPGALCAMLLPGNEVNLAEAYLYNDFNVEGDIERVFSLAEAGLADRARVGVRYYRQVDEAEPYDVLVSVGMFEHVGANRLPTYL